MKKKTTFISLLAHDANIMDANENIHFFKENKNPVRIVWQEKVVEENVFYTVEVSAAQIENLPEEKEGVIYIVPLFVLQEKKNLGLEGRNDLRAPGKKVFGEGGKISFARGLRV